jgi:hypothetical protein
MKNKSAYEVQIRQARSHLLLAMKTGSSGALWRRTDENENRTLGRMTIFLQKTATTTNQNHQF